MQRSKAASFYDLDGTILRGNVVDHYIYYAKTDPSLSGRARRLIELAAKTPYYWALDRVDRRMFNEVFYRSYEGLSQDRLAVLGEELYEKVLRHRIFPGAQDLIDGDRAAGRELVLLTGALDFVARPMARALGIPTVVASRLEYGKNGLATGELLPPVMAGPEKAMFVRAFCRERGLDIEQCFAYADDGADLPLLSTVGHPVCVNPDLRLHTTARSHHWPVVRLDGDVNILDRARDIVEDTWSAASEMVAAARVEGENRWEKSNELVERARGLASWLAGVAREAKDVADAARERARSRKEEKSE